MKNILIVDDDKDFIFLLERGIRDTRVPVEIHATFNGAEALEKLTDPAFIADFIFLDISMPVMDGFEFLQQFRKPNSPASKKAKIIMVSSSLDQSDVKRAKELGADYFLIKPVSQEDLITILNRT